MLNNIHKNNYLKLCNEIKVLFDCKLKNKNTMPVINSIKFKYTDIENNFANINGINETYNVPIVSVHPLTPVELLNNLYNNPQSGLSINVNNINSCIINCLNSDFSGGKEQFKYIYDLDLYFRSNIYKVIDTNDKIYPLDNNVILYSKNIMCVKNLPNIILTSVITIMPGKKEENDLDYYIKIKHLIKNIFKIAILQKHNILILNDLFCSNIGFPMRYIVAMYNYYISKFGNMFKHIYICISPTDKTKETLDYFVKNIFKPQDLFENINDEIVNNEIANDEE